MTDCDDPDPETFRIGISPATWRPLPMTEDLDRLDEDAQEDADHEIRTQAGYLHNVITSRSLELLDLVEAATWDGALAFAAIESAGIILEDVAIRLHGDEKDEPHDDFHRLLTRLLWLNARTKRGDLKVEGFVRRLAGETAEMLAEVNAR